jgi:hypothetical protein
MANRQLGSPAAGLICFGSIRRRRPFTGSGITGGFSAAGCEQGDQGKYEKQFKYTHGFLFLGKGIKVGKFFLRC